jgi:hypothetical protein
VRRTLEIAMAIVKEQQIKNNNGAFLYSKQLENGEVELHNPEGVGIKLSSDQANSFAESMGAKKKGTHLSDDLRPFSIIGTYDIFNSVKEGMDTPEVKNHVLRYFADMVEMGNRNRFVSSKKNIEKHISSTILEYPKVIVEPHYRNDIARMAEAFNEVEGIRLPFPKLNIISGELIDMEDSVVESMTTLARSRAQDGSVNLFYSYILSEQPHGIDVDIFMARKDVGIDELKGSLYIATAVIVHDGTRLQFITEDHGLQYVKAALQTCLSSAIAAIYMMTMGKNNFYMSVPTPEEAATNRKRISKGKKPLIEFKVATIEGKKTMVSSTPHGTHASPRLHWRRGHWRTMSKSGKKTWIAPMEVGDEENGRVIKTYAIGKYSLLESRT